MDNAGIEQVRYAGLKWDSHHHQILAGGEIVREKDVNRRTLSNNNFRVPGRQTGFKNHLSKRLFCTGAGAFSVGIIHPPRVEDMKEHQPRISAERQFSSNSQVRYLSMA